MNWNRCPVCDRTHNRETILCGICGSIAMTEIKNEWETITDDPDMHTLLKNGVLALTPYEYRLQRRKKAKVMPEILMGDGIRLETTIDGYTSVVAYHPDLAYTLAGRKVSYRWQEIVAIFRNGTEIWRREG